MLSVADPKGRGMLIEKFIDVAKVSSERMGRSNGGDGEE